MIWFGIFAASVLVRADVLVEKQLATHCGVLLSSPEPAADHARFSRRLRRALGPEDGVDTSIDPYADVQRIRNFDPSPSIASASRRRLEVLLQDLARPWEMPAVVFVTTGPADITAFLSKLNARVMPLDRDVRAATRAARLNVERLGVEAISASALLGVAWAIGHGMPDSILSAPLESAALVGAAFVARDSIRRAVSAVFPARRLDLDRVRVDSHLRLVTDGFEVMDYPETHIGLSVPISRELRDALMSPSGVAGLSPKALARLLATPPARGLHADRALVDHVTLNLPSGPCLLSAVRILRGEATPGARVRRPSMIGFARPAY